jgi:hypothetical protein
MDQAPQDPQELLENMVEAIQEQPRPLGEHGGPGEQFRGLLTSAVVRAQLLRLALKQIPAAHAAKICGVCVATAQAVYRDPEFRREVLRKVESAFGDVDAAFAAKRKGLHEMLEEQAYESCQDLIDMLQNPDLHPSLRVKINQDFLNRHEESSTIQRGFKMDPSDLRHAAKVAQEMDNVIPFKGSKSA